MDGKLRRGTKAKSERDWACVVFEFLRSIGLMAEWKAGASGFIEGVEIRDGILLVDPHARASALLHEAGHLAIIPSSFRGMAQSNIDGVIRTMLESISFTDPDSPLCRAAMQCSDPEATAWAWAAGKHLKIPETLIIQNDEYDGSGADIRSMLRAGRYLGINGLQHGGLCVRGGAQSMRKSDVPVYPQLKSWLQHL